MLFAFTSCCGSRNAPPILVPFLSFLKCLLCLACMSGIPRAFSGIGTLSCVVWAPYPPAQFQKPVSKHSWVSRQLPSSQDPWSWCTPPLGSKTSFCCQFRSCRSGSSVCKTPGIPHLLHWEAVRLVCRVFLFTFLSLLFSVCVCLCVLLQNAL